MAGPTSPWHSQMPPARIPKLSYRNPLPQDEVVSYNSPRPDSSGTRATIDGSESIRTSTTSSSKAAITVTPTVKKKGSFFRGLFAKEPTMLALAQVEADLKAKHGEATSQKVPYVSSMKMPEHVPKVNTKWDGIPEVVKARDRDDRTVSRASEHASIRSTSSERSKQASQYDWRQTRRMSDIPSYPEAWNQQDGTSYTPSVYTTSTGGSRETSEPRATSSWPQSLKSPSGTSLAEITSFFAHQQLEPGKTRLHATTGHTPVERGKADPPSVKLSVKAPVAVQPVQDSRATRTSILRERLPITPTSSAASEIVEDSPQDPRSVASARSSRQFGSRPVPMGAFLAGEAHPLTLDEAEPVQQSDLHFRRGQPHLADRLGVDPSKRPDSSRQRLGLQASMTLRTDAAPWEAQAPRMAARPSPTTSRNRSKMVKTPQ